MHAVSVEEVHLFLDSTIDAGIARMQTDYQLSAVVKVFHQGKLFFKSHGRRTAYGGSGFGTFGQFARDEATGIENQVGFFKETASAY